MPPMVGGIVYEHGHRMVATFVGILTVILAIWLWKKEERRWLRVLGLVALGAVILQGVLGGLTVLFLLPTSISVAHATLAQSFFCLVSSIALTTSKWWVVETSDLPRSHQASVTLKLAALTVVAVFLQLVFGALMRHTGSGLAVPDFPLAYGQIFPSLTPGALASYNARLMSENIRLASDGPITADQITIHLLHRYWALIVAALLVWTAIRLLRREEPQVPAKKFGWILAGLIVLQIVLGACTVLSQKAVLITTAHVATGALILLTLVLLTLRLARAGGYRPAASLKTVSQEATA